MSLSISPAYDPSKIVSGALLAASAFFEVIGQPIAAAEVAALTGLVQGSQALQGTNPYEQIVGAVLADVAVATQAIAPAELIEAGLTALTAASILPEAVVVGIGVVATAAVGYFLENTTGAAVEQIAAIAPNIASVIANTNNSLPSFQPGTGAIQADIPVQPSLLGIPGSDVLNYRRVLDLTDTGNTVTSQTGAAAPPGTSSQTTVYNPGNVPISQTDTLSNGTSVTTIYDGSGGSTSTTYSGPNGTGSVVSQTNINDDGNSAHITYNPDHSVQNEMLTLVNGYNEKISLLGVPDFTVDLTSLPQGSTANITITQSGTGTEFHEIGLGNGFSADGEGSGAATGTFLGFTILDSFGYKANAYSRLIPVNATLATYFTTPYIDFGKNPDGSEIPGVETIIGPDIEFTRDYVTLPCYIGTTAITIPGKEVLVKDLFIGDTIVTASGQFRPVRWIGRRSYAGRFLAANPGVQPICFCAGSLGNGLPRRDLLVSPEHAMFLDGLLVPARCLVNGTTIVHERGLDRVDYYHVELDIHDVILAEGAPSESFLDDDSRSVFHNASEYAALYPDARRSAGFCAPRVTDGYQLDAIRRRLAEVAGQLVRRAGSASPTPPVPATISAAVPGQRRTVSSQNSCPDRGAVASTSRRQLAGNCRNRAARS